LFVEKDALVEERREALPSPGVGLRHYAPKARLILVEAGDHRTDPAQMLWESTLGYPGERVGLMLPGEIAGVGNRSWGDISVFFWGRWSEPDELARRLFAGLRQLDAVGCTVILCPVPAGTGIGAAIRDRLRKAAWKPETGA
jgi:L-threonylcarbamoyladenylate synthase